MPRKSRSTTSSRSKGVVSAAKVVAAAAAGPASPQQSRNDGGSAKPVDGSTTTEDQHHPEERTTTTTTTTTTMTTTTTAMTLNYPQLVQRKRQMDERLQIIAIPEAPRKRPKPSNKKSGKGAGGNVAAKAAAAPSDEIPYAVKTDTHWDFVMKEMMWLGADFMGERKRQLQLAKKCAMSVKQFHKNKESRRLRELAQAEAKRRKLAAKLGRECQKQFWTKLERVISYKQKLQADEERKKAMNKQLVVLVQQTERYTESLSRQTEEDGDDYDDEESDMDFDQTSSVNNDSETQSEGEGVGSSSDGGFGRSHGKRRRRYNLTIEEALAAGKARKTKSRVVDYSRMKLETTDFYGESTASDASGSDGSFSIPDESETDDEETLRAAMEEELRERRQSDPSRTEGLATFLADPEELRQLHEERTMAIGQVLKRLQQGDAKDDDGSHKTEPPSTAQKKVHFEEPGPRNQDQEPDNQSGLPVTRRSRRRDLRKPPAPNDQAQSPHVDPGADADDDGDASDVEDYLDQCARDNDNEGEEEYEASAPEPDDETTMAQEESLPREMSYRDEIHLLREEADLSIEELRQKYSMMESTQEDEESDNDNIGNNDSEGHGDDAGDEEYVSGEPEVDDETTLAQEESLPRNMTYAEEIDLLAEEANMSIEDLRRKYNSYGEQKDDEEESPSNSQVDDNEMNLDDEEDFVADEKEVDDETTIAQEETLPREMSYKEEINMLEEEANMSIEELRMKYGPVGEAPIEDGAHVGQDDGGNEGSVESDDEEFQLSAVPEVDDETTIEAEERKGREMSYGEEILMLNRENEMSVDELRAKHSKIYAGTPVESNGMNVDGDSGGDSAVTGQVKRKREAKDDAQEEDLYDFVRPCDAALLESDDGAQALSALEASAERARQTLASRPFLLASWVKLRKYQQVGLNWLVSMQTRRLNGILADEMGLGKTLQTISLLAYLASYKGIWGPHLVVVPTSVILNWETELKRFCPGLKVLCYYGSAKRRKELRQGWTQSNWYHVVITSYQLVVQDAFAFKRKKWYYLILDEAQNIKNFQSQRWQTLIGFNTQRRLLLTGTPLQNSLMELWSLLHFLMPYIFRSRKEFSYWFSNPMNNIIEGNIDQNNDVIQRLHGIIRPFVLRRLKKDVETQMPGKFEHIVKCQLSRRQMTLYEEFLSRSSTRQALTKGGNFMGMMNVLMQLRKVCNHPDLFEPRSVVTPFVVPSIVLSVPRCMCFMEDGSGLTITNRLSKNLIQPLWCGSSGAPSVGAALRHDQNEADALCRLVAEYKPTIFIENNDNDGDECPLELQSLLDEIRQKQDLETSTRIDLHNVMNRRRCSSSPFLYPSELLDSLQIECSIFDRRDPAELWRRQIIESPSKLLELRRSQSERATDLDQTIEKFVFCVPRAGATAPRLDGGISYLHGTNDVEAMLLEPLEESLKPYQKAHARLSSFFPDKKLVQYDAGKLQTLAQLLRKLKQGRHRALIFTQMSKMLDILEAFLNIHGYTYLRLDGATGVDRRQRYMDHFNNDEKIFCFILSTRSGGLGINLTGADTVIFYDSDWNPAMDAQAQDRAHRIGQTRDVHIYRLITEHTIEENILSKALQKKNLDILVMDQGKFDASSPSRKANSSAINEQVQDMFSKKGLQAILGVASDEPPEKSAKLDEAEQAPEQMTKEQMEMAMTALEDDDDVQALRGAQKETAEEMKEFDESENVERDLEEDDDDDGEKPFTKKAGRKPTKKQKVKEAQVESAEKSDDDRKDDEKDLQQEFAAWQTSVGLDADAIENSLSPLEKYALRFKENVDPFYSIFAINEDRRRLEAMEDTEGIDVQELEREKAMEEAQALDNGDLLSTGIRPEDLVRQRNLYRREKARLLSEKKRRKLTGENWSQKVDGLTKSLFWYNDETGEAMWEKPKVVLEIEADELAATRGWSKLPIKPLFLIMSYLVPMPERQTCALVCRQWNVAAYDVRFVRHVYPVEMGALARDPSRMEPNHYATIAEALAVALPGDSIELADGHFCVSDPGMIVDKRLKLIGDEENPSNVVIEMSGSIQWTASGGWIEGVTFRRPKLASGSRPTLPIISVVGAGKVDIVHSVFDNDGSTGPVSSLCGPAGTKKGTWKDVVIRNGGSAGIDLDGTSLELIESTIRGNKGDGIKAANQSTIKLAKCTIERNLGFGVRFPSGCKAEFLKCTFEDNARGVMEKVSNCGITSSGNRAVVRTVPTRNIPGFKLYQRKNDGRLEELTPPRANPKLTGPKVDASSTLPVATNPCG